MNSLSDHDRLGRWMEPYADPAWQLIEQGYDPTREPEIEACFAISNGLLGSRAARSISRGPTWVAYQHHLTWASWERTYVAGLYDTPNVLPPVPGLVPAPDWLRARIWVNDNLILLRSGELQNYRRTLDLRRGLLLIEWVQRAPTGHLVRVRTLRAVSLADRAVALQLVRIGVDGAPARVRLEASFESTTSALDLVRGGRGSAVWRTAGSGKTLAISARARLIGRSVTSETKSAMKWTWDWEQAARRGDRLRSHGGVRPRRRRCSRNRAAHPRRHRPRRPRRLGRDPARPRAGVGGTLAAVRHRDRGRRRHPAGAALRALSPDRRREPGRRDGVDRRPRADRRFVSRPRLLGHRNLPAAVLHLHLARGGARIADVSLPHPAGRARQGGEARLPRRAVCVGIDRHRRGDHAGTGDRPGGPARSTSCAASRSTTSARTSPMRSGNTGRPRATTNSCCRRAPKSCWTRPGSGRAGRPWNRTAAITSAA